MIYYVSLKVETLQMSSNTYKFGVRFFFSGPCLTTCRSQMIGVVFLENFIRIGS